MLALATPNFSIDEYLAQEREKDLLRFSTAGSVDDGKSTLIGRLLYDTQSVYDDQLSSIRGKGTTAPGQIDFALLTDGLRAEREQGITIDVAYRYFSTPRRKFIIADTPGHEQYTRNMATGASTADAAVVLIDASKGVLIQSRRHAYIASLLRVRHVLVAVNKMDLIGYDKAPFDAIERDFSAVLDAIAADTGNPVEAMFVPVSALAGDNIVHASTAMRWYDGPSLLELLESLPTSQDTRNAPFRFPVQRVLRPDHTFRGFAGQIASGTVRPGDTITVLPSGRSAEVDRIVTWDGDLSEARAPLSVSLVLNRELDISRGDLLVSAQTPATIARRITAALVWMDHRPLDCSRRYLLKHTSQTVPAFVTAIDHRTEIGTLTHEPAETLEMNGIGVATLNLLRPIAFDPYGQTRSTGAFILIDQESNATVAAGMIHSAHNSPTAHDAANSLRTGPITAEEWAAHWGHRGGLLELSGRAELINQIERSLFQSGAVTTRIDTAHEIFKSRPELLDTLINLKIEAGVLALIVVATDSDKLIAHANTHQIAIQVTDPFLAISAINKLLERAGILPSAGKVDAH